MPGRRGNHEGSIYQRASDGRWFGVALLGYDDRGRPVRKSVSAANRSEVVRKLKQLRRQIDEGQNLAAAGVKLSELFEHWFEDVLHHQVAPGAARNYRTVAEKHIIPTLGGRKIVDLSVGDVDRLLSRKLKEGLSTSTVRRIRSVLAQCLDQGIRWGVAGRNVARLSRAPRLVRQEGRTLSPEQAKELLRSLKGQRLEALIALMLSTGLRRGEALGLMWQDFDARAGVLRVQRQLKREEEGLVTTGTKTARSRRAVNLPAPLVETLREHERLQQADRELAGSYWEETGFIFTTAHGTPIDPRNFYRDLKKIFRDAGLGDWHPHELRHSAASLMLAQGVKLQVVSQVLGHASIRMTADVYGHVLDPDREEAAKAMGEVLWSDD
jgi:integrase